MNVFVESISRNNDSRRLLLGVRFGSEAVKIYQAEYDDSSQPGFSGCTVDQELFMRLSRLAHERYCNCALYHMEIMGVIGAFVQGKAVPKFPIELGTTSFGFRRPGVLKIWFDRARLPFYRVWSWWKCRHIRRENKLKYGTAKLGHKK